MLFGSICLYMQWSNFKLFSSSGSPAESCRWCSNYGKKEMVSRWNQASGLHYRIYQKVYQVWTKRLTGKMSSEETIIFYRLHNNLLRFSFSNKLSCSLLEQGRRICLGVSAKILLLTTAILWLAVACNWAIHKQWKLPVVSQKGKTCNWWFWCLKGVLGFHHF